MTISAQAGTVCAGMILSGPVPLDTGTGETGDGRNFPSLFFEVSNLRQYPPVHRPRRCRTMRDDGLPKEALDVGLARLRTRVAELEQAPLRAHAQAEAVLHESARTADQMIAASPVAMVVSRGSDGRIMGFSSQQLIGRSHSIAMQTRAFVGGSWNVFTTGPPRQCGTPPQTTRRDRRVGP